jgi:Reverse transcriptase (RNA-dependent DNA polymerase)
MLHAIKALYDVGVHMHIKTPAGTLDPIFATVGVKQGCPLSPTMFGIYIDGLQQHVAQHLPQAGPALDTAPHLRMSLLIYADDTAILANSADELQQLLTCVDDWCSAHGMTISTVKSEVVVFNSQWNTARRVVACVQGKRLPVSKSFKYLGLWFHHAKGISHHVPKAAARGKLAIACLGRRLSELDVGSNIYLSLHLYECLVLPAMLYGCETWGWSLLSCTDPAVSNALPEQVHRNFVKFTLRMRSRTKAWVAFREAGMYPLQHTCLRRMLTFLDNVLAMDDGEFAKVAMLDCIAQAGNGATNWFSKVQQLLSHCTGGDLPAHALQQDGTVDVEECLRMWRKHQHAAVWGDLHDNPRTAPSTNITLCTYHSYFGTDLPAEGEAWSCAPCIAADHIPYHKFVSLINLRTNSHNMNIERLRHTRPRVPRAARTCPWCTTQAHVQDELHCVLECPHFAHTRLQYPALFPGADWSATDMRRLFVDGGMTRPLASFAHALLSEISSPQQEN